MRTENELKGGRRVLFSGTPCQIAGLKAFLRKDYDNLLAVDVLCHGVPSTRVFQSYVAEIVKDKEPHINMRPKKKGWKSYHIEINDYFEPFQRDVFMQAFLKNLILRPSCYDCKFKNGRCPSDISLGDFWGVKKCHKELDDDKGLSLFFLNTKKGKELFDEIDNIDKAQIYLAKRFYIILV